MATRLKRRKKNGYTAPVGAKGFDFKLRQKVDPKTIGAELRRLRVNAQVTVGDLAERMGWIPANLSRLESGSSGREPTISSVNLYLRTLGYECFIVARPKKPLKTQPGATEDEEDGEP